MNRELLDHLKEAEEIELTVTGRKTGRLIPRPVWFATEDRSLLLLPQFGPSTHWYRNIMKDQKVKISVRGSDIIATAVPISDQKRVKHIVELFNAKYGKGKIDKYYSNITAAAEVKLAPDGNA